MLKQHSLSDIFWEFSMHFLSVQAFKDNFSDVTSRDNLLSKKSKTSSKSYIKKPQLRQHSWAISNNSCITFGLILPLWNCKVWWCGNNVKPNGAIVTIANGILRQLNVVPINTLSTVPKIRRYCYSLVCWFCTVLHKVSVH